MYLGQCWRKRKVSVFTGHARWCGLSTLGTVRDGLGKGPQEKRYHVISDRRKEQSLYLSYSCIHVPWKKGLGEGGCEWGPLYRILVAPVITIMKISLDNLSGDGLHSIRLLVKRS